MFIGNVKNNINKNARKIRNVINTASESENTKSKYTLSSSQTSCAALPKMQESLQDSNIADSNAISLKVQDSKKIDSKNLNFKDLYFKDSGYKIIDFTNAKFYTAINESGTLKSGILKSSPNAHFSSSKSSQNMHSKSKIVLESKSALQNKTYPYNTTTTIDNSKEQFVLKISMIFALILAILGIAFGIATKSSALLFDGIVCLLSVGLGLLSVITSCYIYKEDDDIFQYGYVRFEPMVNLFKSLMLLVICVYAFIDGVRDIFHGGYKLELGGALVYTICAFVLCVFMFIFTQFFGKRLDSDLIKTDVAEWRIDSILYLASILAFGCVFIFDPEQSHIFSHYIDCILLVILSIFISFTPFRIFIANLKDLMMVAPAELDSKISEIMENLSDEYGFRNYDTHVAKNGRFFMIEVNILSLNNEKISIGQIDILRDKIIQNLNMPSYKIWLSVSLTADAKWL